LHIRDEQVHGMTMVKHGQCFAAASGRRDFVTKIRQEFGGQGEARISMRTDRTCVLLPSALASAKRLRG
jgi:hypothetical protein